MFFNLSGVFIDMASNPKPKIAKAMQIARFLLSPRKLGRLWNIRMLRHSNEISKKIDVENYVRKTYAEQRENFGEVLANKHTYHFMIVHIMECMKLPPRTRHIVEQASLDMEAVTSFATPIPREDAIGLTGRYLAAVNAIGNDFPSIGIRKAYFLRRAEIIGNLKVLEKDEHMRSLLDEKEAERMYNAFEYMRKRALSEEDYRFLWNEEGKGLEILNSL